MFLKLKENGILILGDQVELDLFKHAFRSKLYINQMRRRVTLYGEGEASQF